MSFLIAIAPIVILIFLMTKRNATPSHIALPIAAAMVYLAQLFYFGTDANLVNATVVKGVLTALTPILIIGGAIYMFRTMEASGGMNVVRAWLNGITGNQGGPADDHRLGFRFPDRGRVRLRHPGGAGGADPGRARFPRRARRHPVPRHEFGAGLVRGRGHADLVRARPDRSHRGGNGAGGAQTALIHTAASLIIPLIALLFVVDRKTIRANLGFIYLSILACVLPYLALAFVNYEFPSLLGGLIGTVTSVLLARQGRRAGA